MAFGLSGWRLITEEVWQRSGKGQACMNPHLFTLELSTYSVPHFIVIHNPQNSKAVSWGDVSRIYFLHATNFDLRLTPRLLSCTANVTTSGTFLQDAWNVREDWLAYHARHGFVAVSPHWIPWQPCMEGNIMLHNVYRLLDAVWRCDFEFVLWFKLLFIKFVF